MRSLRNEMPSIADNKPTEQALVSLMHPQHPNFLNVPQRKLTMLPLRSYPTFITLTREEATQILKSLVVVPVALGVIRAELGSMIQGANKQLRTSAARV